MNSATARSRDGVVVRFRAIQTQRDLERTLTEAARIEKRARIRRRLTWLVGAVLPVLLLSGMAGLMAAVSRTSVEPTSLREPTISDSREAEAPASFAAECSASEQASAIAVAEIPGKAILPPLEPPAVKPDRSVPHPAIVYREHANGDLSRVVHIETMPAHAEILIDGRALPGQAPLYLDVDELFADREMLEVELRWPDGSARRERVDLRTGYRLRSGMLLKQLRIVSSDEVTSLSPQASASTQPES